MREWEANSKVLPFTIYHLSLIGFEGPLSETLQHMFHEDLRDLKYSVFLFIFCSCVHPLTIVLWLNQPIITTAISELHNLISSNLVWGRAQAQDRRACQKQAKKHTAYTQAHLCGFKTLRWRARPGENENLVTVWERTQWWRVSPQRINSSDRMCACVCERER